MNDLARAPLSFLPVLIFLAGLVLFDSYKLVRLRAVILASVAGCMVAVLSMFVNGGLLSALAVEMTIYSRYVAPVLEELLKASYVIYLLKTGKVGFLVDAAIFGFAVGTGFALVENLYYLNSLEDPNLLLWAVRGFGTAIMHGGTMAIFSILSKNVSERRVSESLPVFLPGLGIAIVLHSIFNHFVLPPLQSTLVLMLLLPLLIVFVFEKSEKATRDWLDIGFDTDILLLDLLTSGNLGSTKIGKYLSSMKENFPGEIVADMLCLLRVHLELTIRAKGILLMRETGFQTTLDPEIEAKFEEIKYLEKSIGKIGRLAIGPFLHTSNRDLWQLYFVK